MIKKILFITHSSALTGGAEDDYERLLKYFSEKKEKYDVHGLFPAGPRVKYYARYCSKWGNYRWGFLPVIYEDFFSYVKYFLKSLIQVYQIWRFASGQKYDLTIINVVVLIWPSLIMRLLGSKVIVFIREDIYPVKLRHLVYKLLAKTCNFFMPNSITKEKNYKDITHRNNIMHMYPGVEDNFDNSEIKLKNVISQELLSKVKDKKKFKFINPAGVFFKKNQILLLKALNELKKSKLSNMPYVFFLGSCDMTSDYKKMLDEYIKKNSLESYCFFLGEQEKSVVYEIFNLVDATILTSFSEGMPIVLVESFKFQKPVISTKVGGIPEVIIPYESGFLVDFDEKQIGDVMLRLMNDKGLYDKVKENALLFYKENFNLEKAMEDTDIIFQKVLNGTL